jgi:hypothetical protein
VIVDTLSGCDGDDECEAGAVSRLCKCQLWQLYKKVDTALLLQRDGEYFSRVANASQSICDKIYNCTNNNIVSRDASSCSTVEESVFEISGIYPGAEVSTLAEVAR